MGFLSAGEPVEKTCAECGTDYHQDVPSTRCIEEKLDLCCYDCAMQHQERTGHYLTHLIS